MHPSLVERAAAARYGIGAVGGRRGRHFVLLDADKKFCLVIRFRIQFAWVPNPIQSGRARYSRHMGLQQLQTLHTCHRMVVVGVCVSRCKLLLVRALTCVGSL
jgi:hypothetical protein